ncbi:MAG: pyridoxal 5'-phosphate synthase glutaminase subunit PdxT [Candidatus Micrarchaeota archaeon]
MKIGILALQGGVIEHINATNQAAKNLGINCEIIEARTKEQLQDLDGLIIPGGESTVLQKLCEREHIFDQIKHTKAIFGTCAGAILLAKKINNREAEQKTLGLMDIEITRNDYGRQNESFEQKLETEFGNLNAIFIRAPRIKSTGTTVKIIAKNKGEVVACVQQTSGHFYLATCFHPELSTIKFHEYFLNSLL